MENLSARPRTLSSWKEIAAYLGKGVRTVQRWEQEYGLPVRRPDSTAKGIVVTTPEELELWLNVRWKKRPVSPVPRAGENGNGHSHKEAAKVLRAERRDVLDELLRHVKSLQSRCEALAETAAKSKHIRQGGAKSNIQT